MVGWIQQLIRCTNRRLWIRFHVVYGPLLKTLGRPIWIYWWRSKGRTNYFGISTTLGYIELLNIIVFRIHFKKTRRKCRRWKSNNNWLITFKSFGKKIQLNRILWRKGCIRRIYLDRLKPNNELLVTRLNI